MSTDDGTGHFVAATRYHRKLHDALQETGTAHLNSDEMTALMHAEATLATAALLAQALILSNPSAPADLRQKWRAALDWQTEEESDS